MKVSQQKYDRKKAYNIAKVTRIDSAHYEDSCNEAQKDAYGAYKKKGNNTRAIKRLT